jgi:flagellar hook-basal body complex protein FliE
MINAIQNIGGLSSIQGLDGTTSTSSAASTAQAMLGGASAAGKSQSFADVMGSMASDMVGSMKKAEVSSLQGIRGEANTREVIDAVMNAEQSLQTAIAVRDKVVSAYLEIARMPI